MNLEIIYSEAEGFVSRVGLRNDAGLLLLTESFLWSGVKQKAVRVKAFTDFVNELEALGAVITGRDKLAKI